MRARRGGGPAGGSRGTAGQTRDDAPILADAEQPRKQDFGACIGCGIRIAPSSTTVRCATCAAWRRWFSAHRIASAALREATQ